MIDIHSHILPFVDDGSDLLDKSLQMLKECDEIGVTDVILTPHCRGEYNLKVEELKNAYNEFCVQVKNANIKANVYLGQEIFVQKDLKNKLKNGELLTLNQSKFVLVEMDYSNETDATEVVYELVKAGYSPIVAHVERFPYITDEDVKEIKALGGYVQVNASAIFCRDFRIDRKRIKSLFKQGLVDFVASDIHSNRENYMAKAYKYVKKKYGEDTANAVFYNNAKMIIDG